MQVKNNQPISQNIKKQQSVTEKSNSSMVKNSFLRELNAATLEQNALSKKEFPDILLLPIDVGQIQLDWIAWTCLKKLNTNERKAYLRGGVTRKSLQGIPLTRHDEIDIVTDQTDEFIRATFENMEMKMHSDKPNYYKIYLPDGNVLDIWRVNHLQTYEDTLNGDFKDGAVYARLMDDQSRKAQTFSHIANYRHCLHTDNEIHTVIPARQSLHHNPINIFRVFKRSASLQKKLDDQIKLAIPENMGLLHELAKQNPSYVNSHIYKIFSGGYAAQVFSLLMEFQIMNHLFSRELFDSLKDKLVWITQELREIDFELQKIDHQLALIKKILSYPNQSQVLTAENHSYIANARTQLLELDEHRKKFLLHRIYALFIICLHAKERVEIKNIKDRHLLFDTNFQRMPGSFNRLLQEAIARWGRAHPDSHLQPIPESPESSYLFSNNRYKSFWNFCPDFHLEEIELRFQPVNNLHLLRR